MLGDELVIREIRSNHVIDYRLEDSPGSGVRWRDRLRWTGHLFGAREEMTPRLIRNLPVPFRLSGTTRRDEPVGEETIREAFVNLLIHTDYIELSDARIIVTSDGFSFDNPGNSRVPVESTDYDAPDHFSPSERRNPLLSSLFAHANQAELAGSGVRSMRTEWRSLGFQLPRFHSSVENYRFSVFLSLRSMIGTRDRDWLESIGGPWTENEEYALLLARDTEKVDNQQLRELAGLHPADATRVLQRLRDRNVLYQCGYGKGSSYSLSGSAIPRSGQLKLDSTRSSHTVVTPPHNTVTPPHNAVSPPHNVVHITGGEEAVMNARPKSIVAVWEELEQTSATVARSRRTPPEVLEETTVRLCTIVPLHRRELMQLLGRSSPTVERVTSRLIKDGKLRHLLVPASHADQRYTAIPVPESNSTSRDI